MTAAPLILTDDELYTAVVCTVRYSLGRSTYVVSDAADLVRRVWPRLRTGQRRVVWRDVHEALRTATSDGRTLGMQMDHDVWTGLLAWMEATP